MTGYVIGGEIVQHSPGSSTWYVWVGVIFFMGLIMIGTLYFVRRQSKIS